jgi:membrane fusion protein (multidrug efflux system)
VLVRLDTRQEQAQLAAAEAQRKLARLNLERSEQLLKNQVVAQAEYDRVAAEAAQADARVGEIEATIERKRIRAPFAGVLGIRRIDLGQYMNGGDAVVPLQSMDPVYVNFALPQQEVAALKLGAKCGRGRQLERRRRRRDHGDQLVVDAARGRAGPGHVPQSARRAPPRHVRRVQATTSARAASVRAAGSAITTRLRQLGVRGRRPQGPNGKTYRGVEQRFVKLGDGGRPGRGGLGVKAGEEVVTSGVFKLRTGAAVVVDNKVQPGETTRRAKPEDS